MRDNDPRGSSGIDLAQKRRGQRSRWEAPSRAHLHFGAVTTMVTSPVRRLARLGALRLQEGSVQTPGTLAEDRRGVRHLPCASRIGSHPQRR